MRDKDGPQNGYVAKTKTAAPLNNELFNAASYFQCLKPRIFLTCLLQ